MNIKNHKEDKLNFENSLNEQIKNLKINLNDTNIILDNKLKIIKIHEEDRLNSKNDKSKKIKIDQLKFDLLKSKNLKYELENKITASNENFKKDALYLEKNQKEKSESQKIELNKINKILNVKLMVIKEHEEAKLNLEKI